MLIAAATLAALFNPAWVGLAQGRADVAALTGWSPGEVDRITAELLDDVVIGPPRFDVAVAAGPVLGDDERRHMVDVFAVLRVFAVLAAAAGGTALAILWRHRYAAAAWRAVAGAARGLGVAGAVVAVLVVALFDPLWLAFHLLLFPQGNFTFDPSTQRLTQLFPESFWVESAVAAIVVAITIAIATWAVSRRQVRRLDAVALAGTRA